MCSVNDNSLCRKAEPYYFGYIAADKPDTIPQDITAHIQECEDCRSGIERLSNIIAGASANAVLKETNQAIGTVLKLHFACLGHSVACKTAKPFLPMLLDLSLEIKIPTPITVHLDNCESCSSDLEAIRNLHLSRVELFRLSQMLAGGEAERCVAGSTVQSVASEIMNRPESGIITVYHLADSHDARILPAKQHGVLYSGFPVNVEVIDVNTKKNLKYPAAAITGQSGFSVKRLMPFVKFGGLAAAVVILAVLFMFNAPSAKAITLAQIYKAVQKVQNVHTTKFTPGKTEPVYNQWVSRSLDVYITRSRSDQAIWDLDRGTRKITNIQTGGIKKDSLTSEDVTRMEAFINGFLGMMPFEDISAQVKDSQWHRMADASLPGETSVMEVYDLLWVDKNSSINNKWRFFVDPASKLPRRTEFYQLLPGEEDYIFTSFSIITYPTDDEIRTIIDKSSSESKSFRTP
jgi:hypothetical protein